jgi:membrane protease YdiL (CAAX protease family)
MANMIQKYTNSKIGAFIKSILFIIIFLSLIFSCGPIGAAFAHPYDRLVYGLCGIGIGYFLIWVALRIDNQPFSSIGMKWEKQTLPRFFLGMLIGLLFFIPMMAALLSFTTLSLTYNSAFFTLSNFVVYLPIFPLAFAEELCFRSYPQVKLNSALGIWTSQFVVAVSFGVYHILVGWSAYSAFTGPFVWAFIFGLAALKYGGIAVPTGIHFALNVLQSVMGTKGNYAAIWKLDYLPGTTKAMMDRTEHIGLLLQVIVFIVALTATALYIRERKAKL